MARSNRRRLVTRSSVHTSADSSDRARVGANEKSVSTIVTAEPRSRSHVLAALSAALIAVLWAYWPILADMARKWSSDPQYSHSYLVPLFSLYLVWANRSRINLTAWHSNWWGLLLLAAGLGLYLAGAYMYVDWFQAMSLLPALAGIALLLGGWPVLRHTGLAISFLVFMIPLPYRIETALSQPLQRIATISSTYVLQTIGLPAVSEGNVIIINEARIGVVEACNGLGMLLLFVALATAVAIVVRRSYWEKALIVASSIPIAVASNIVRISVTGILAEAVGMEWAEKIFHDLAGWLMMPVALGMLCIELWILSKLFVDVEARPRKMPFNQANELTPEQRTNNLTVDRPSANLSAQRPISGEVTAEFVPVAARGAVGGE
jgi:exosortase